MAAVGCAILRDTHTTPLFSWGVGYFNLWVALLITPAMVVPFLKTDPFAYNGLLALYLPFGAFFLWMIVMALALFKSIQKHEYDFYEIVTLREVILNWTE